MTLGPAVKTMPRERFSPDRGAPAPRDRARAARHRPRHFVKPARNDAVGFVVGDQDGIAGDRQAVHLPGDSDRVGARARACAMRPTIGTSARLPGANTCAKFRIIEDGEDLPHDFRLLGGEKIRGGAGEIALGRVLAARRRNIGQRLHQPMHQAAALQRLAALGGRGAGADCRSHRRRPTRARAAREAAPRPAPAAAARRKLAAGRLLSDPPRASALDGRRHGLR